MNDHQTDSTLQRFLLFVGLSAICSVAAVGQQTSLGTVTVVSAPPINTQNDFYAHNRQPLLPSRFIKLPVGSIRPEGWIRGQLERQAGGFLGRLEEISRFCRYEGNAWTHARGEGEFGWEEVPYWLRGFLDMGYILDDERIKSQARKWIEAVLDSQRPNGYFGSEDNLRGERYRFRIAEYPNAPDLWPNMVMLFPLRSFYEATGDERVISFMKDYFRWQSTIPLSNLLPMTWSQWRAGDNLDSIHWLYNRTGEEWLLDLARANHEATADWSRGIPTWHVVNLAECFREPGQFYQQSGDPRHLQATERIYDTVRGIYGQVPGGLYAGDENARPGFTGPRQGTETCAMAEMLYSHEMLTGITGNPLWADRAEDIAFNSLPASMTPDLTGLHYVTAPNMVQLDRESKSPMIQNGGDMLSYNPHQYRCCQHNVSYAWPYYAAHLWMATPDNGLAPVLFAPSKVTAKVGDGTEVTITEETAYPFEETVSFHVSTPRAVRFPLTLRVPGWCDNPRLTVNGRPADLPPSPQGWLVVDRTWSDGDTIDYELPMRIQTTRWTKNRNTLSVHRGPLSYSLKIGERWEKYGAVENWPGFEVFPTTAWNYGLVIEEDNPSASFEVVRKEGPIAGQPFTPETAPIMLRAKGRLIPEWELEPNGLIEEVQESPVRSAEPIEELTLIPMGAARLRIASFPVIGDGAGSHVWEENPPLALASYSTHLEPPTAMHDGEVPADSADLETPRFTWLSYKNTVGYWPGVSPTTGSAVRESGGIDAREWVEYRYSSAREFSAIEVYWADDQERGGRVRLPGNWRLSWWDGDAWQPVDHLTAYEAKADDFSRVEFRPVKTTRLRLDVECSGTASAGIFEWRTE